MTTIDNRMQLREQAIALRLAGKSRREIKEILGPISNSTLNDALAGTPPPDWARRPNAKDDIRARARELRSQGLGYNEIVAELGVSKSSVSLWVRDLPQPPRMSGAEGRQRAIEGARRYWERERQVRDAQRAADVARAAEGIGDLSDREVLIAGAIAYWCEGGKRRPPVNYERVIFVNSDPGLVRFFLRFLAVARVQRSELTYNVNIHESADIEAAKRFWEDVCTAPRSQFTKPTLKRHNPKTNRNNTGESYHGCLRISVYRSSALYRKIEGWAFAAMSST